MRPRAEDYLGLVDRIARELVARNPHLELGDIVGAGVLGLMDAISRFDPARAATFPGLAAARIRGAILDQGRRQGLGRTAHSRGAVVLWLEDLYAEPAALVGETAPEDSPRLVDIAGLLDRLPAREREVIRASYWDDEPLHSIGARLGVTESRASQIRIRALKRLRGWLGVPESPRVPRQGAAVCSPAAPPAAPLAPAPEPLRQAIDACLSALALDIARRTFLGVESGAARRQRAYRERLRADPAKWAAYREARRAEGRRRIERLRSTPEGRQHLRDLDASYRKRKAHAA
jgi:RNA polymerase sigma factor for flagellar operon FliA